jgi:hypothetical protein
MCFEPFGFFSLFCELSFTIFVGLLIFFLILSLYNRQHSPSLLFIIVAEFFGFAMSYSQFSALFFVVPGFCVKVSNCLSYSEIVKEILHVLFSCF